MALGDLQDGVYESNPVRTDFFPPYHRGENFAQSVAQAIRPREQSIGGLRIGMGKLEELGAAIRGDYGGRLEKVDQFRPGKSERRRDGVHEVDGEAATNGKRSARQIAS